MKNIPNKKALTWVIFLAFGLLSFMPIGKLVSPPANPEAEIEGAWRLTKIEGRSTESVGIQMIKILSEGHFMFAYYNEKTQQFFSSGGGTYEYDDGVYTEKINFHTINPEIIGTSLVKFKATFEGDTWYHKGLVAGEDLAEVFTRIDDCDESPLAGAWSLVEEENETGKLSKLKPRSRTRIKLLSDTQFQWVEYDSKKGDFIAAGGGRYEIKDNKYVEDINYFSDDSTWVGREIGFTFETEKNRWHHKQWGVSRGDERPINEVWKKL